MLSDILSTITPRLQGVNIPMHIHGIGSGIDRCAYQVVGALCPGGVAASNHLALTGGVIIYLIGAVFVQVRRGGAGW